jgi:hypothetical protein
LAIMCGMETAAIIAAVNMAHEFFFISMILIMVDRLNDPELADYCCDW